MNRKGKRKFKDVLNSGKSVDGLNFPKKCETGLNFPKKCEMSLSLLKCLKSS